MAHSETFGIRKSCKVYIFSTRFECSFKSSPLVSSVFFFHLRFPDIQCVGMVVQEVKTYNINSQQDISRKGGGAGGKDEAGGDGGKDDDAKDDDGKSGG